MTTFGQGRTAVTSANRPGLFSHEERSRWLPVRSTLVAITAALLMVSVNAARDGIAQEVVLQPHDTTSLPAWNSLVLAALENRRAKGRNDLLSRLFREKPVGKDLDTPQSASYWESHTLQTCDYLWLDKISQLERGRTDDAFDLIQGWQQMPPTAPFQANGAIPGDFVVLRDGRNKIRVLVYAGKGTFRIDKKSKPVPIDKKSKSVPMDKKPTTVLQDFFYYSWLADRGKTGDPDYRQGVRKLQLNTYPPKITLEIAQQSVSKKTSTGVSQKPFNGKWLQPNVVTSKQPESNRRNMQFPIGWNKQTSGRSYCVVRMKPQISAADMGKLSSEKPEEVVEGDLRLAIKMADHAAKMIREPAGESMKVFELAFGVKSPTLQQRQHAAGIYDAFRVHLVKGMIVESDGGKKSLAHVRPGARWIVFIDPPYFRKKEDMRASILIHEFCHAWGYRGHPGTGGYAKHAEIVQEFLKSKTMQSHSGLIPNSLYEMHRMVSVDERSKPVKVTGFLNWKDAHRNAYSYGNFALWLWQQKPKKQ